MKKVTMYVKVVAEVPDNYIAERIVADLEDKIERFDAQADAVEWQIPFVASRVELFEGGPLNK